MGALYWSLDRAREFTSSVSDDRKSPDLKVLQIRGFDQFNFTLTKEQLQIIGDAIAKETGGNTPF